MVEFGIELGASSHSVSRPAAERQHVRYKVAQHTMGTTLTSAEVYSLLSRLCIDLGFCLPPDKIAEFQQNPPTEVDSFTNEVFVAEGLDPLLSDSGLRKQVSELVSQAFSSHSGT